MNFATTTLNRKSGGAQWRDLRCDFPCSNSEVPNPSSRDLRKLRTL
jgi:hypothetical protein